MPMQKRLPGPPGRVPGNCVHCCAMGASPRDTSGSSNIDKLASKIFGQAMELWTWPFVRDRLAMLSGWLLAAAGAGGLTAAGVSAWTSAHLLATVASGCGAAVVVGVALLLRMWRSAPGRITAGDADRSSEEPSTRVAPAHTAVDWSLPSAFMFVKMRNPMYYPNGREFIADFRIGATRRDGMPANVAVRSFIIELRLNDQPVGEYDHRKSDIPLSSAETSLGRVLIAVKVGDGPTGQIPFGTQGAEAEAGQWNIKVTAHVVCELDVEGLARTPKLDYWTEEQCCAVKLLGW